MGYPTKSGRWADTVSLTLAASAARTATANGTTPTLDVVIQTSHDGTTWRTAHTFTQATATGTQRASFTVDRFVRASWTVDGTTPSFTFAVTGEAA